VLVTGAAGQVGRELVGALGPHDVFGCDHTALDVADGADVRDAFSSIQPDVVVHCAAFTAVDACESEPNTAFAVNGRGTEHVMEAARAAGAYVVYVSTDYVFDGTKPEPYLEDDEPNPQSVYGQSKLAGEAAIDDDCAIVRTSWVCGRYGPNMVKTVLRLATEHDTLRFVADQRGHPTFAADLAVMLARFVDERPAGIWHVTNQGAVSWFEFAQEVLRAAGSDPSRVQPISTAELQPPRPAPRPANSVLANARLEAAGWVLLPDFRTPLAALVANLRG
jgi:dTDP-4-dehydrorhamnose reductase